VLRQVAERLSTVWTLPSVAFNAVPFVSTVVTQFKPLDKAMVLREFTVVRTNVPTVFVGMVGAFIAGQPCFGAD
jgi:hypothetical protein